MKENLIKNIPLFAGLSEAEQQALADRMHLASYRAGEQVFAKGEASDAFYLIQEGWVKLTYESSQPAVATLGPGSLLGEAEFFQGNKRGMAAYAQTPLSAWVFGQDAIHDVIRQHSEIGLKLGLVLGFGISQYRKYLLERVGHLAFLHALDAVSRQAIVDRLVPQSYPSNEVVFRSGDAASGLYLVESGTVRLINDDGSYEEVGPGEALGELAVLAGKPHPHSAQVVSPAVIWQLSPTDFTRLAEAYLQLRTILGRNLRSTLSAADRVQAVEMLKRIPLFVTLGRQELDSAASRLLLRYVQAGGTVFVPGDAGDAMYLIESGHVEIISTEKGQPHTLARLIPGDYFGEMALLTGRSRTVTARAIVHTNLWALSRSDFDGLLVKHPALAVALSRVLRERLAHATSSFVPPYLHGLAVSGDLSRIQIEELAGRLTAQTYRRGDAVFYEGRSGDAMYFIESGRVDLVASGPRGPVALSTFEAGDFFGETALLTGMPHSATARMAADGTLWALKKSDFDNLLQKHPNLAVVLSRVSSERQTAAMDKVRGSRDVPPQRLSAGRPPPTENRGLPQSAGPAGRPPRPSRPASPPAPKAPPRQPGAAPAPGRPPERPADATSRPAPAPRPAPGKPPERPADAGSRPAPVPRLAPGKPPERPADTAGRPAPAAPKPAPATPAERPARPYRPAPPSERALRPVPPPPERPIRPERAPSPSAPPTSTTGEAGEEEQPPQATVRIPPERPAPPEPIPHAALHSQPERPAPPVSGARDMAATEAVPRIVARPQPERPVPPAAGKTSALRAVARPEPTAESRVPAPAQHVSAPSGRAHSRPKSDEGTSRKSKPVSGRLGGRIGALAVWFTTRSRHVKVGLLILLLLLVWLCGVTLPSTLINELSANLNGADSDFNYAYAQGGNGLGLARPLLLPGARENGAVAALPFIETVTPTPSLTPTPTDTPTITPTSTGTPLPTWTPTHTVTFTPPPPTSTPTPTPDTPTPKPRAQSKPRRPTDTPTPEPTPTPDVDYIVASVRQLPPCENEGKHHIFINVVDQSGLGLDGVPVKVCWGPGENDCVRPITETKGRGKGWIEFAMFKGTYNVRVDGAKSMVASGITPDFQLDEMCPGTGNGVANSRYHASFEVTLKKVR